MKARWESIADLSDTHHFDSTVRMKVVGGWLVRTVVDNLPDESDGAVAVAMTFVPDPDHEWEA